MVTWEQIPRCSPLQPSQAEISHSHHLCSSHIQVEPPQTTHVHSQGSVGNGAYALVYQNALFVTVYANEAQAVALFLSDLTKQCSWVVCAESQHCTNSKLLAKITSDKFGV